MPPHPLHGEENRRKLPSKVRKRRKAADVAAVRASHFVSTGTFAFTLVAAVVVTFALGFVLGFTGGWHAWIASVTGILAVLFVAILQNESHRETKAVQHKLNALAYALLHIEDGSSDDREEALEELRHAMGVEEWESVSGSRKT